MDRTSQPRIRLQIIAAGIAALGLVGMTAAPATAAGNPSLWCWSMRSGSVQGTFTMSPDTNGDGSAPAGTYTLTDAAVYDSPFAELLVGSISDGTFIFGGQPSYQVIWNGSAATTYQRSNGAWTNGFGVHSNVVGKAGLTFDTNYEAVSIYNVWPQTYSSNVAPTLSPAPASGLCPGQSPPASSQAPAPGTSNEATAETAAATSINDLLASTGTDSPFSFWIAIALLGFGSIVAAITRSFRRASESG